MMPQKKNKEINIPKETMVDAKYSQHGSGSTDANYLDRTYHNNDVLSINSIIALVENNLQPIKDDLKELKGLPVEIAKINTNLDFIRSSVESIPKIRDDVSKIIGIASTFAVIFSLLLLFFNTQVSDLKENIKSSDKNVNTKLETIIGALKNIRSDSCAKDANGKKPGAGQ